MALRGARNTGGLGLATLAADANDATIATALRKDFGIELRDKQARNTIDAFTNPAAALVAFQAKALVVDTTAVDVYKKALASASDLGIASDKAVEYARKRAYDFHEAEMELLYIAHPYATAEGMIGLATGAKRRDIIGNGPGANAPVGNPAAPGNN